MASSLEQNRQGKWKLSIRHGKAGLSIPAKFTYNGVPVAFDVTNTKEPIDTGWQTELGTSIDFFNENEVTREYTPVIKDGIRYIVHKPENIRVVPYQGGDDTGETPYLRAELYPNTVESGGGQVNLAIESNVSWQISDNSDYLMYSKTQGSNNDTVFVSVPAYANTGTDRTNTITVSGPNGLRSQQTITQKKASDGGGGDEPGPDEPGTDADYVLEMTMHAYNTSGSYCPGLRGLYADTKLTTEEREDIKIDPTSWVVKKRRFNQSESAVSFVVSNSVSDSDRSGCEFWICSERYTGVVERHGGSGTLNIHGYGFKNKIVNDGYSFLYISISATTMGGKHISTQIALKGKEYSFIRDGQSEPYICPQTGGVIEHTFWYANIDESTFGFTNLSDGISNITLIESGVSYTDPGAGTTYYRGKLAVTLNANQAGESDGYEASQYKYFTITGMSTLDTTEQYSCRCRIMQEPYSYVLFLHNSTDELNTYDPNRSNGLLIIPLSGLNINNFSYRFCAAGSLKSSPDYIDDNSPIEWVEKEDGTTFDNEITYGEAMPISLEHGSTTINGNQINGYYLTIENQAWKRHDTRNGNENWLVELTFYDTAGNSWKDGLCMRQNTDSSGRVTSILYRGHATGWYC